MSVSEYPPRITFRRVQSTLRVSRILVQTAAKGKITVSELRNQSRARRFSWPRQEAYARLASELGLSQPRIAQIMRRKDHTTVGYGIAAHEAREAKKAAEAAWREA